MGRITGSTITYTYDANGNLLTGDGATYTYDARNRQVGYVKGSDFATYTYYPSGLRKTRVRARHELAYTPSLSATTSGTAVI